MGPSGTKWDVSMPVPSVLADLAMPAWVTDDEGTEAFGPLAVGHEVGGLKCNHVTAAHGFGTFKCISKKMGENLQSVWACEFVQD